MKRNGFSLAEMLIAALVAAILLVAMAPTMTRRAKGAPTITATNNQGVPVGSIVLWYGDNIPQGWAQCQGQVLSGEDFLELKTALGGIEQLPNLNPRIDGTGSPLKWIIKISK